MDKIYLLKRNRILLGPYTVVKLEERTLRTTDLVWYEGLPDWTEAGSIEALKQAIFDDADEELNTSPTLKSRIVNLFSSRK